MSKSPSTSPSRSPHDVTSTTNILAMPNSHTSHTNNNAPGKPSQNGSAGRNAPSNPDVEALFLVRFDSRVGYTIAWQRTRTPATDLDGVEYKALPSGLHAVQNDLVYFTHTGPKGEEYVGLSAFAQSEAGAEERGARFVSVGVLVRREGVLGRAWVLAGRLEGVARELAGGMEEREGAVLERVWGEVQGGEDMQEEREEEELPEHHPARSVLRYVDVCGPLVFRLQQAALLRKRVLFVGGPPVRGVCEFVYTLTVLSSISPRDTSSFLPGTDTLLRIPSLFSIGVHDIPLLETPRAKHGGHTGADDLPPEGWIACTTDEIIATKKHLFDIIVDFDAKGRWPSIRTSEGDAVRASQRDLARWKMLRRELARHERPQLYTDAEPADEDADGDAAPLLPAPTQDEKQNPEHAIDDTTVEPITWSHLAYLGFMWWASAGEKDAFTTAERDMDRELVACIPPPSPSPSPNTSKALETHLIGYFHRMTSGFVRTLAQLIQEDEGSEGEGDEGDGEVLIDRDDVQRLGLDVWSQADRAFVGEFAEMYCGRGVRVVGGEVRCCGVGVPVF
ncbi:hypothetical protein P153DRAFT_400736 [Dothidotthia symphoricarpi CBS 119687]|uniref:DUF4484 domain-containing protein n=1 Tax=Dothidotthia symphoricarpi CBS 119687 TaxID=1392245 RepID=A0A6A5ZYH1_9PLEO|nr:uncharacterized protein P153DRAFT_400736 [Dothidotthia symphoricarpi CBS 119687]KAF2124640.1 hypothetical protein P153DRAFT_400736 [Dothidotthia symphoricarpi CBS 119687]